MPAERVADDLATARYPGVAASAGHYESYYLKLADPQRPRGAWIRYTVLKRPGEAPRGSLWCTVWTGEGPPRADKLTVPPEAISAGGADRLISVGPGRLSRHRASGSTATASWELDYEALNDAFPYLPAERMYRWRLPRTKAVSLIPRAVVRGTVAFGEQTLSVDGWPGMLGHNWGSEHAERWIWLHGAGFPQAPEAWFDATIGRIRVGRVILPWIANAGLWLDGRLHRLGGPSALLATRISAAPGNCRFALRGRELGVRGEVAAPAGQVVGWRYADPAGGEHLTANCSVAALTLSVRTGDGPERVLRLAAGAAYELGAREPPAGITVQAFPDP
jgi:hypothetical protein